MKVSGVLPSKHENPSGVVGTARVERRPGDLLYRVRPGDIAILDQVDLDRRTAEAFVAAGVVGVLNVAPSISGRFPNQGPEVLLAAGIVLIDSVGRDFLHQIKDGTRIRTYFGSVFAGPREIARGDQQDAESVADRLVEAKAGMSAQLEAFSANTIEFLRKERTLLLDGVGVPELETRMEGRHVVVVAPGYGHADDFRALKPYIREYRPVLIGVESAADALINAGHTPDLIVGDPVVISSEILKCGAEVVIPADLDGHAPGVERVQDLGVAAVTFPAVGNSEDLALLLADAHSADLVVTVGFQATLTEFLDRGRSGSNPSTFLTRLKLGSRLVDGSAVVALQRSRIPRSAVLVLILAVLVVTFVALVVSGFGNEYVDVLAEPAGAVGSCLRGLFP